MNIHMILEKNFVLEGVFSDENGNYPAGTYIRNPHNSQHKPFSKKGCKLFVKLRQFNKQDDKKVVIDTLTQGWAPGLVDGLQVIAAS